MTNIVTKSVELIYQMDMNELNQVVEAIKLKRTHLAKQTARMFMVGDVVSFTGKRGELVTGVITKVNPKTMIVKSKSGIQWRVTASLLTKLGLGQEA
jgi:hypothetical protein